MKFEFQCTPHLYFSSNNFMWFFVNVFLLRSNTFHTKLFLRGGRDLFHDKYYKLLGLDAANVPSDSEVKKAYHRAALKWHPDRNRKFRFHILHVAYLQSFTTRLLETQSLRKLFRPPRTFFVCVIHWWALLIIQCEQCFSSGRAWSPMHR